MAGQLLAPCPDCRGRFPAIDGPTHAYLGASPGCWAAFGALTQRELDMGIGGPERLSVHVYAVQHPGTQGRREAQSVGVHLMVLACVLERAMAPATVVQQMQRWLATSPTFPWLEPPAERRAVTLADLSPDAGRTAHEVAVRRWAETVWAEWSAHHDRVREWVVRGGPG